MARRFLIFALPSLLAACAGLPSMSLDFLTQPSTGTLRVESDPPGAEARSSTGQACRTPCVLSLPTGRDVTIGFTLDGYLPLSVAIQSSQSQTIRYDTEATPAPEADFSPNPVLVALEPAPMAKKPPKKPKPRAASQLRVPS